MRKTVDVETALFRSAKPPINFLVKSVLAHDVILLSGPKIAKISNSRTTSAFSKRDRPRTASFVSRSIAPSLRQETTKGWYLLVRDVLVPQIGSTKAEKEAEIAEV